MKRNAKDKVDRMAFIKMTIEQPEDTIKFLESIIKDLKQVSKQKKTFKIVKILRKLLFLSEQTIYKDYYF